MTHPNADRMEEMGNKFIDIHQAEKMSSRNLNFDESFVDEKSRCNTVACHGGWGSVIFDLWKENSSLACVEYQDYISGANAIADFIGFKRFGGMRFNSTYFEDWAEENPELWGNEWGEKMFGLDGYISFGFDRKGECTLEDIGNHYIQVAARIRQESAKNAAS